MRIFLSVVMAISVSTAAMGQAAPRTTVPPGVKDSLHHILQEENSGLREAIRSVVRDSATWRQWWERVTADRRVRPQLPVVNFARDMLVIVALGTQSSTGYNVNVDSVTSSGRVSRVYVRVAGPGRGCVVGNAETSPVDVVRVPKSGPLVAFVERTYADDCKG